MPQDAFTTYEQVRQAEDVQDEIYIISPIDNPVAAMSRTIRATGKLHEWTEDELPSAASNKKVEGAPAGAGTHSIVTELNNHCQIMDEVAEVSGTLEDVDKYGRDSEMAYQLELKYGKLANDEELAIMGAPGGTRQAGSAGTEDAAREFTSFHNQLDASVVTDATSSATFAALEADLVATHLATYTAGGNPSYLVVPPALAQYISSFAYASGRNRDIRNERRIINVVDLYVSSYGELDVVLDRHCDASCMALIDFNYTATPVLRSTSDWALAKDGDSDKRQILREGTFAVLNTKAHGLVDNVQAGITS